MNITFVMLKPDALERELAEQVLQYFKKEKIEIELFSYKICTRELIRTHYAEVIERLGGDFEEHALHYFEGRPAIPVLLKSEDPDIVAIVRQIIGATDPAKAAKGTIRGDFGIDSMEKSIAAQRCCENIIHASDSKEAVIQEATLWFGQERMQQYM